MASRYDDDEAVNGDEVIDDDDAISDDEEDYKPEFFVAGDVMLDFINEMAAPMETNLFNVRIEMMPTATERHSLPQDIVILLDASSSMVEDGRLERVKAVARNIIHRLNRTDRLSVIIYEGEVYRLCKLQLLGDGRKDAILRLIDQLKAGGGSNLEAGLREAMKVLDGRKFTKRRRCTIVLLSDGDQHADGSVTQTFNVPLHTIHYGHQPKSQAFQKIASSSNGGSFTFINAEDTETSDNFIQAISNFVAVQLRIVLVVRNLKLTLSDIGSKIETVHSGNFPQYRDDDAGSVTISFGDLHDREKLSVSVDILLNKVWEPCSEDIIEIMQSWYSEADEGYKFEACPIYVTIYRKPMIPKIQKRRYVTNEEIQQTTDETIEAIELDNTKRFEEADPLLDNTTNLECDDDLDKLNLNLMIALSELPRQQRRSVTKDFINNLRNG